jgi:hypothetical protein
VKVGSVVVAGQKRVKSRLQSSSIDCGGAGVIENESEGWSSNLEFSLSTSLIPVLYP